MGTNDERINEYIANAADFAKPILSHLRELVHRACPEVEETWKWSFPHFMYKAAILCSMAAFKRHCAFGFWKAALLEAAGILPAAGGEGMGDLGKIESMEHLPNDAALIKYIKAAMALTEDGVKLPPRKKASAREKDALATPPYFETQLNNNKIARKIFDAFSYSNKKDYIEWLEEAKTEATRSKRMATAIEWIAAGKSRHWKYMDC